MTGLQKQIINLSFSQGVDTKSDPFQIPLGKLLTLENATFISPGKLSKRNGYTQLTDSTVNSLGATSSLTGVTTIFTRGNELCAVGPGPLYSYDYANTVWAQKGNCPSLTTTLGALVSTQYSVNMVDMAQTSSGLQCFVYELYDQNNATGGSRPQGIGYAIIDSTTGQVVVPPAILDATATSASPHVIILGTNFCVYYIQGNLATTADIYVQTISTTNPALAASGATKVTSGTTTSTLKIIGNAYQFDAVADSTNATGYLSFNNRSDGTTVFRVLSATPSTVTSSTVINLTNSRISTVFMDLNGNVALAYSTAAVATAAVFSSDLSTTVKAATVIDNALANYTSITGTCALSGNLTFFIGNTSGVHTQQTRKNTLGGVTYGTLGTASYLIRSLAPAAKAFSKSSVAYVPLWYCVRAANTTQTADQSGIYLVDASGNVMGRALVGVTGGYATLSGATGANTTIGFFYQLGATTLSSSTAVVPATASLRFSALKLGYNYNNQVTMINYQYGAQAVSFNFSDTTNNYIPAELANTAHLSGGILQMYDGESAVEHGFLISPQQVTLVANGGGGSMSAGTYQYLVFYEWMDAQGQIHTSAPNTATSVTTVASDKVTLTIPTLRVTAKTGVLIQVFRTAANGTTFYQLSNFNQIGSLFNDKTVDTVSWVDTQADTAIAAAPQPYVAGGVLQNSPCNPAGPMCVHRNRIFVVDSTNPTQVWYSEQVVAGTPVQFSGFLILNIDPKGGAVTALASMDDKLIVFKSDRIFMVLGQGPDRTGGQNDFTDALLVTADAGCAVPKSIVLVPDGLMFQSPKGIYQLSRALQVSYIGAPVQSYTSGQTIGTGLLMPDRNQVWFPLSTSIAVYDYLVGQWSKFTTLAFHSLVSWRGTVVGGRSSGGWQETIGTYVDPTGINSGFITMLVSTGWIRVSGISNFQRVYELEVLGAWVSDHVLGVGSFVDYTAGGSQSSSFAVTTDPQPYRYRCRYHKQKCEAIRIVLTDSIGANLVTGASAQWSGLALLVGLKKGPFKLPAAQSGA